MKNVKRMIALMMVLVMAIGLVVPASAATSTSTGSYVQVTIDAKKYSSAFTAYDTEDEADKHPITIAVNANEFPVSAKLIGKNGAVSKTYEFDSYGVQKLTVSDIEPAGHVFAFLFTFGLSLPSVMLDDTARYATIKIEKPTANVPASPTNENNKGAASTSKPVTKEDRNKAIDEKLDKLLDELDFGFIDDTRTPYGKELRAFLTGEWDGSRKGYNASGEEDYAGYAADRRIFQRTYYWDACDLYTGKSYHKSVNVDYIGYKEVIPAPASTQDFSFAVSYANGEIEEWSLLEQRNAWKLDLSGEHIDKICLIGTTDSESRGIVHTLDTDGQQHMYFLDAGNKVLKIS